MTSDFHERQDWFAMAMALSIWAAHFALLWTASSVFPGALTARWIALAATIAAILALGFLWRRRGVRTVISVPGLGIALALAGVAYGMLPALIG